MGATALAYPFTGRWQVRNSPADRVPSHGTRLFGLAHAIDFVPVTADGRTAPYTVTSLLRPQPPTMFPGFGRPVLAPADGVVVAILDEAPDHRAYRGFPSVGYALTQQRRAAQGWAALAGNHVILRTPAGLHVSLCHLRLGSLVVAAGDQVTAGAPVAQCGNSGNSTEPHLHLQVTTAAEPPRADAVPFDLPGGVPRNGTIVDAG